VSEPVKTVEEPTTRIPREPIGVWSTLELGLAGGILAGLGFLLGECLITALLGGSLASPLRLPATLLFGPAALGSFFPTARAVFAGAGIDLLSSALLGVAWVSVVVRMPWAWSRPLVLLPLGLLYGALLWLFGPLILGALAFPQVAVTDFLWNGVVGHAVFFGGTLAAATHLLRPDAVAR